MMSAFTPVGAHTTITSGKIANKEKSQPMISSKIKFSSTDFCLTGIPIYTKFAELPAVFAPLPVLRTKAII
jgi:hypothetical protein